MFILSHGSMTHDMHDLASMIKGLMTVAFNSCWWSSLRKVFVAVWQINVRWNGLW